MVVIIHSRFKSIKLEKLATHFIKNIFNKTGNKTYGNENRFSIASAHSTSKTYFRPSTSAKIKISIIINDTCFHFSAIWNFMTMTISMKTCLKWHVSCLKWGSMSATLKHCWPIFFRITMASKAVVQSPVLASFFRTEVALVNFQRHKKHQKTTHFS